MYVCDKHKIPCIYMYMYMYMFSIAYCTCSGLLVHFMYLQCLLIIILIQAHLVLQWSYKEFKKDNVISNKVCSQLLLVLLLLLACVFPLLAFDMFVLLCFTGI